MRKLIIWIDSGDTLVDEGSEYRKEGSEIVEYAELIPGAKKTLETLKQKGFCLELVADGLVRSFDNVYRQHGLEHIFDARIISEAVGAQKPDASMFETALVSLGLTEKDKSRIVMVGNNLKRDIVGANRFGITSVLVAWSPRYCMIPETQEEKPDYILQSIDQLPALAKSLEELLTKEDYEISSRTN